MDAGAAMKADVAQAWASLRKAKAMLQKMENELELGEQSWAWTRTARRPLGERSPALGICSTSESSRVPEDAAFSWDEAHLLGKSHQPSCRLKDCFLGRGTSPATRHLPIGRLEIGDDAQHPTSRTRPLPSGAINLSKVVPSEQAAPSHEPLRGFSSVKGNRAPLSPASGAGNRAPPAPRSGSSAARPSPSLETCHLAWKLEDLKENSPNDKKLQELKKRIREQRHQALFWVPTDETAKLGKRPLKRKVHKAASSLQAPASTGQGRGNREAKKNRHGSREAPLPAKAPKDRGASLFGPSAWREGQKLAKKILGPPLKYPKLRSTSAEGMIKATAGPDEDDVLAMSQAETCPQEKGVTDGAWLKSCQITPRKAERTEWGGKALNPALTQMPGDWMSPDGKKQRHLECQKDSDVEMGTGDHQSTTSRKENAGPATNFSDGVKFGHSFKIQDPDVILAETGRHAMQHHAKRSRPSQRISSAPCSPTRDTMKAANSQPPRPNRWCACRKSPFSPDEVREFMNKKAAERNRQKWEEKKHLKRAHEERNQRLQEVYRKQREAFSSRKSPWMAQQEREYNKTPGTDTTERIPQASSVLLQNEVKERSDLYPQVAKVLPGGPMLDWSLLGRGNSFSPLKLKDLSISSPKAQLSHPRSAFFLGASAGFSPERTKHERVRAIEALARDLTERLERETKRLQGTKSPVESRNRGCPEKLESQSKEFCSPAEANAAMLKPSPLQSLLSHAQNRLETSGLDGGVIKDRTQGLPITITDMERLPWGSHSEGQQSAACTTVSQVSQKGSSAPGRDVLTERNLYPEKPNASSSALSHQFLAERFLPTSQADSPLAVHQNNGGGGGCYDPKHLGYREHNTLPTTTQHHSKCSRDQPQSFGQSSPSVTQPLSKMSRAEERRDNSETTDSTSQWSEISQFYGGSSTFCRFGLAMAEQYLREEELRARHQSALLRLREQALQEKTMAELAWLEHEKRCQESKQDTEGASAIPEQQHTLMTKLKQEQAEIRHLQNVCRAAHQERKLLLMQQKELLVVQQSTAQLWKQLCTKTGKPQQQGVRLRSPTGFKEAKWLGKEKSTEASQSIPSMAERAGDGSSHHNPLQGKDSDTIQVEREEAVSQDKLPAQKPWPQGQEDSEMLEMVEQDMQSPSEQVIGSAVTAEAMEIEGPPLSKDEGQPLEAVGLMKHPTVYNPCCSSSKGTRINMDLEGLASAPKLENPLLHSEFHKAHAVLVNISGSSLSGSDLEVEDAQDTDVSLPEEFIFHKSHCDDIFPETPAISQLANREGNTLPAGSKCHSEVSQVHSDQGDSLVLISQEKTLEVKADRHGTYESEPAVVSKNRRPRPSSSWEGESLSFQIHVPARHHLDGGAAVFSKSCTLPCAKTKGVIGKPETQATLSFSCPENRRASTSEADCRNGNVSHLNIKGEAMAFSHQASLQDADAIKEPLQDPVLLTRDETRQPLPSASSDSSKHLLASDGRMSFAEYCTSECIPSRLLATSSQLTRTSMGGEEAGASLICAAVAEGMSEEHQDNAATNGQNTKESGVVTDHLSSPKARKVFQVTKSDDGPALLSDELWSDVEEDGLSDILSPVDEVLSYGSTDLPSSTKKDFSSGSEDFPAPPEDLDEKGNDSYFSLKDFPSPPEFAELQYFTDEDASLETSDLPPLSDNLHPGEHLPQSLAYADVCSAQLPSCLLGNENRVKEKEGNLGESHMRQQSFVPECLSPHQISERYGNVKKPQKPFLTLSNPPSDSNADPLLSFEVGNRVLVKHSQPGTLKFKGCTSLGEGCWAGVALDHPDGDHDGAYEGVQYFECPAQHGIFVKSDVISHLLESAEDNPACRDKEESRGSGQQSSPKKSKAGRFMRLEAEGQQP